jgi:DNA-binding SARP family transcriptional activator/DNA-binding XRE family transcriptional regulator
LGIVLFKIAWWWCVVRGDGANHREFPSGFAPEGIAELLKQFRRRAGLTQREVAIRAGLSVAGLCDLEQKRVLQPRPSTLRRLADALELSAFERAELMYAREQHPVRAEELQVRVLGPLSVTLDGECVDPQSVRHRKLLGLLALSPRVPVSRDVLVEHIWGSKPPPTAQDLLQTYVYRLRKRIFRNGECANILATRHGGYQLTLEDNQLDLLSFRRRVEDARRERKNGNDMAALASYQRAVGLWRGAPLADLPDLHQEPCVAELEMERQAVIGEYADTAFALGRHAQLIGLLRREATADPLNEATHARLIVALARAGRQATALEVFSAVRTRLGEELGVAPSAELRGLHEAILRGDLRDLAQVMTARTIAVPRQLPGAAAGFVGHADELAWLTAALPAGTAADGNATTVALLGAAGVGKTALAVRWARQAAHLFQDGQLFIDLGGYRLAGSPQNPGQVIRGFLQALGVPSSHIPTDEGEQVSLYRSLLADKRVLIVLDNARDTEQVRPFLLASPRSMVIVTSRSQLRGLIANDGALPLAVRLLSRDEAGQMLARRLGAERISGESAAVEEIISVCSGLPLALTMVAARVTTHCDFPLSLLAKELRDPANPLHAIESKQHKAGIRSSLSCSYDLLSPQAARLFRLLGVYPDLDVDPERAARLSGATLDEARALLADLASVSVVSEYVPGRYMMHDLTRAYAADLFHEEM